MQLRSGIAAMILSKMNKRESNQIGLKLIKVTILVKTASEAEEI